MEHTEIYEEQTGNKAICWSDRYGSYHTLEYIKWLEEMVDRLDDPNRCQICGCILGEICYNCTKKSVDGR